MKDNYTEIAVILDRSGSMCSITTDTIGGFNQFLKDQRQLSGEAKISLYQFDNKYQVDYEGQDVQTAPELNGGSYVPRGATALFDAMGKTIVSFGERISKMPEELRPGKVVVVIVTDGHENASREYNQTKVFDMVKHQTDVYRWAFIYLGANQDAISTASSFGGYSGSAMTFAANTKGVTMAYASLSSNMSKLRGSTGSAQQYTVTEDFFDKDSRKDQDAAINL